MGAILEGAEALKNPINAVVFIAILAGGYYFIKWVLKDDDEQ
ncbi:MAG: hypothetical protein ACU843_00110 [Gammaproteobacteria bacterium]